MECVVNADFATRPRAGTLSLSGFISRISRKIQDRDSRP
jgi:hypothetical protein